MPQVVITTITSHERKDVDKGVIDLAIHVDLRPVPRTILIRSLL